MVLIDKNGERPVCVSCHRLGSYADAAPAVFICEACARAAEDRMQVLAESVPELRDHRLKRWRHRCDCRMCQRGRSPQAV